MRLRAGRIDQRLRGPREGQLTAVARAAVALAAVVALYGATPAIAGVRTTPVIPSLEGPVGEHVREIAGAGSALGNDPDVFAKIGDSITESGSFLQDIACADPVWGRWSALAPTVEHYRAHEFPRRYTSVYCGVANSFSRASASAVAGWSAADALEPLRKPPPECAGISALSCEYKLLRPAVALVMYGTNDLESYSPQAFAENLHAIVDRSIAVGVVPVLSTIPSRLDGKHRNGLVARFNRIVIAIATSERIPLWNFWRSLRQPGVIRSGVAEDGVHLNIAANSIDFTRRGLRYGYNRRNLGALRILDAIRGGQPQVNRP